MDYDCRGNALGNSNASWRLWLVGENSADFARRQLLHPLKKDKKDGQIAYVANPIPVLGNISHKEMLELIEYLDFKDIEGAAKRFSG